MDGVMIAGMNIPESCCECPMCHPKGRDEPWNYACYQKMLDINIDEFDRRRHLDCPLRSVDGLMKALNEDKALRCIDNLGNKFISEKDIEEIIKKYCEEKAISLS